MINQSFDALFAEECAALRAPTLKVQFVGRQGKAQRRKVLRGQHKPSKVLSEGEQKVLAIADFLAEHVSRASRNRRIRRSGVKPRPPADRRGRSPDSQARESSR